MIENLTNGLKEWQELVGAAIGPFFAVLFSAIGYWIKLIIDARKERREMHRRIEIGITQSIDDAYTVCEQIKQFAHIIRDFAAKIKVITDDRTFSFNRTNFPIMREIYRDIEIPRFKVKSYYLHNKLLLVNAGIKDLNKTIADFKNGFEILIRQNEMLIALLRTSQNPNPAYQRAAYIDNLENFATVIEEYATGYIQDGVKNMIQVKVYNNQLRKRHGCIFLWKYEGISFKYFRSETEKKEFARNLDSLDRIDSLINQFVEAEINAAEKQKLKYEKQKVEK